MNTVSLQVYVAANVALGDGCDLQAPCIVGKAPRGAGEGELPLAIGAALETGAPAICFVGDAGLEMVLGELATARDLGVSVVVVVLVDSSLALIELKQRQGQLANTGVDFGATDFPAVAAAMGGHGVMVETRADLDREARAAMARKGVTVLACRIARRAYDGLF